MRSRLRAAGDLSVPADRQTPGKRSQTSHLVRSQPTLDRWRVSNFEAIELLHGVNVTQEHPRHWHDELYVTATLGGTAYLDCLGTSLLTRRGTLAIVAPGDVHANRKIAWDFRCIFLVFRALQKAVEEFMELSIPGVAVRSGVFVVPRTSASFFE